MARKLSGRVVLATHNVGKLKEMRELLAPHGVEVVSAGELNLPEPEENGATFEANARIKAEAAARAAKLPAFADDSGLTVDALNGDPGIYSARWAGPSKDFSRAMRVIEEKLAAGGCCISCATKSRLYFGLVCRMARRRNRFLRRARGRHAGVAAAWCRRFRL